MHKDFVYKLYNEPSYKVVLKLLTKPAVSRVVGRFLDMRLSTFLIPFFIKNNNIDMSEVAKTDFLSFNDFFTRKLAIGSRVFDMEESVFASPCDGLLSVYPIKKDMVMTVKDVPYTISKLLKNKKIAARYEGGKALVFRLTPSHYHRYNYPVSGKKSRVVRIHGVLHTVRPAATMTRKVYAENTREFSVIRNNVFGDVLFMQVGALLVGRISNKHKEVRSVNRGEEAGWFDFGGSTIIVLVEKGKLKINKSIKETSLTGREYPVRLGERIGQVK